MKGAAYEPKGVIPAVLLPFDADLNIDEKNYRRHLRQVVATKGISAITVNGHSTEVLACSNDEQKRVLDIALDEVGDLIPVVNGVFRDSTAEAGEVARWSETAGAAALLVAPPSIFRDGVQHKTQMAFSHFGCVAAATDLPIIKFQFQLESGMGLSVETQMALCDEFPTIRATKDACGNPVHLERTVRALQGRSRPVNVLTTHSAWLLQSLVAGCNGMLSGAGSTVADLQVALFEAVQNNQLSEARAIHDRYYPMAEAFYAAPFVDMHNRMKEVQVILGRLPNANIRPPLVKISSEELKRLKAAVRAAGIGKEMAQASAGT